eukprot:symbB.v1.2.012183.t1/scaffold835.1/size159100/10
MTEILLDKLYSLGLSNNEQSLEDCHEIPASKFCRRRLAVILVQMKFADGLQKAITYIKQAMLSASSWM